MKLIILQYNVQKAAIDNITLYTYNAYFYVLVAKHIRTCTVWYTGAQAQKNVFDEEKINKTNSCVYFTGLKKMQIVHVWKNQVIFRGKKDKKNNTVANNQLSRHSEARQKTKSILPTACSLFLDVVYQIVYFDHCLLLICDSFLLWFDSEKALYA